MNKIIYILLILVQVPCLALGIYDLTLKGPVFYWGLLFLVPFNLLGIFFNIWNIVTD